MNAAHRPASPSKYLPAAAPRSGLVVTFTTQAQAPLTVGRCECAKTNPDRALLSPATFATIFSSFRIDGAFFATTPRRLRCDPIDGNTASRRFFAASATVSMILGGQSTLARRFDRPNPS
jgi:hypothetical protein